MQSQTTNQTVLFHMLASVILPSQGSVAQLTLRRSELAQRRANIRHIATLPVPFRSPADWLLLPGSGCDWAFMPITADPLYRDQRGFPVPKSIIRHLRSLKRQNIEFDAIWIAHEVQPGRLQPGQALTVADLMPPLQPKRRPAWHGALAMVACAIGLALIRGAFGAGQALGTMPTETARAMEPAGMPTQRAEPTAQPARVPERPMATAERPAQAGAASHPSVEPVRPAERRAGAVMYSPPATDRTPAPRQQSGGLRSRVVTLDDGSEYITHDVTKTPRVDQHGNEVYPDQHGFFYPEWFRADGSIKSACLVDPILFGVNIVDGIADLFYLGAWAYQLPTVETGEFARSLVQTTRA